MNCKKIDGGDQKIHEQISINSKKRFNLMKRSRLNKNQKPKLDIKDEKIKKKEEYNLKENKLKNDEEIKKRQNETFKSKLNKTKDAKRQVDLEKDIKSNILFNKEKPWYEIEIENGEEVTLKDDEIMKRYFKGKEELEKECEKQMSQNFKSKYENDFIKQILTNGTISDKIASHTLFIQENPILAIKSFEILLNMCKKKSRKVSLKSIESLKELFLFSLLPNRKLKYFKEQKFTTHDTITHYMLYYYEDSLKKNFLNYIIIIEKFTHDTIPHVRKRMIDHLYDIIVLKPEQECNILKIIINKLGDNDKIIASKAHFLILELEHKQPLMKKIIIDEIIENLLKSKYNKNLIYYSLITLNQTILKQKNNQITNTLINFYFLFFEKLLIYTNEEDNNKPLVKTKVKRKLSSFKKNKIIESEPKLTNDNNSKLFSALFTGLNRTLPFSTLSLNDYEKNLKTLYSISKLYNFTTKVQSLKLIYFIISKQKLDPEEYYDLLYEILLTQKTFDSSKKVLFLNLIYNSLKNEHSNEIRVIQFIKKLLQISLTLLDIDIIVGIVYLVQELSQIYTSLKKCIFNFDDSLNLSKSELDNKLINLNENESNLHNDKKNLFWELVLLTNFYHPTASIHASFLIENVQISKPNLKFYTINHFLDKFVYKNPKLKSKEKGHSIMQPLYSFDNNSLFSNKNETKQSKISINKEIWTEKIPSQIKPDELFFYNYFINKKNNIKILKENTFDNKNKSDDEYDSLDNELYDDMLEESNLDSGSESTISSFDINESHSEIDSKNMFSSDYESDNSEIPFKNKKQCKRSNLEFSSEQKSKKSSSRSDKDDFAPYEEYSKYLVSDDDI